MARPPLLLVLLILTNFIYFGLYATQRHLAFETGAFDLGVYAQPLWNFVNGRDFSVSLMADNGPLRWANHVEPLLFLIAPIYKIWPDPRTLLWLQVAGLSLSGLPLYGLAVRRLQLVAHQAHNEWAALVIVLAYFLMPATEAVTLFDFHAVSFAPLFLLSALYFLERALAAGGKSFWLWPPALIESASSRLERLSLGFEPLASQNHPPESASSRLERLSLGFEPLASRRAYALSALFFLLALSTKEDISLHVFMIGLYLALLRRCWREGGLLMAVGLAWFYVAFQVIIPAFRTGGEQTIFVAWFEPLGRTPLEIALSPLTTPDKVVAFLFRPDTLPPLAMLTVPLALLPWAGLPFFVLAAPSLALSLLSQNPTPRQLETWHYAAPMLPFVMLAAIDGLARLSALAHYLLRSRSSLITHHSLLALLLLVVSLGYHHLRGYSALSQLDEWPAVTAHHQLGREMAAMIPAEASVLAQAQLVPHVAHRYELAIWSGPLLTDYDYIWLDLSHPKLPNRFNAHGDFLTGLVIEDTFGFAATRDGYILLQKGARREPHSDDLFTFTQFETLPPDAQPFSAVFSDTLKLVAVKPEVRRLATSETEPQVILFFETLQTPPADYRLFIYLLDETGQVVGATDYPQPAIFWWPTSRWQAGDRRQVRVNTIPWWTEDKSVFGYALGLTRSDDPWDTTARLPLARLDEATNPPGVLSVADGTLLPIAAFERFAGLPYPRPLTVLKIPSPPTPLPKGEGSFALPSPPGRGAGGEGEEGEGSFALPSPPGRGAGGEGGVGDNQ